MLSKSFAFLFVLLLIHQCICEQIVDLGGNDWSFTNAKKTIKGKATVPGNIFQDLKNNKIIDSFFAEYSDVNNTWIAHESWIYTKKFTVSTQNVKLVMNSLDTVGQIHVNGKQVVPFFENMFVKKEVYLNGLVQTNKENTLEIQFYSPVEYVNDKARKYKEANGVDLPPTTHPGSYHGVEHSNFIRKMQASFSWDWGAQFVTSGIVGKIYLVENPTAIEVDSIIVDTVRVKSEKDEGRTEWMLISKVNLKLNANNVNTKSKFRFYLNDKEVGSKDQTEIEIKGETGTLSVNMFAVGPFAENEVLPWFPNGVDYLQEHRQDLKPNLHNFTVVVEKDNKPMHKKTIKIGFREIKLREEKLADGKSFYFEINGLPLFAKGVNYIPTTLNIGNLTEQKSKFTYLLNQVKGSNMNMIRVWGGGFYPIDEFYELTDELGILVWQDFMYACALYEADDKSLELAKEEVTYQVRRLQHHPSIAIFAGNNENEGAISNKWWPELKNPKALEKFKKDYILFYEKTIRNTVQSLTNSIPYVGSSPTNNDNETFINVQDPRRGDIHFYDYNSDTLNEAKYPRARFASEFGYQSYPSLATLSKALKKEHLVWPITPELEHRQHAPGQNKKIIAQITENFVFKNQNSTGTEALEEFIYLSQVSQALAIKTETEGYLHDRDTDLWQDNYSLRPNVKNLNMGTLIWQLNDVWEAPSWSSIDYYQNHKILQYYMRKFYNPIHVVAHKENDSLVVTLINDSLVKVKMTIYVIIYKNVDGYLEPAPVATYKNVTSLDKTTVQKQNLDLKERLQKAGCGDKPESCFVRIDYNYLNVHLDNFYFLGKPKDLNLKPVEINSRIMKLPEHKNKYVVIVNSDKCALFVHLSFKDLNIQGKFIDNGFNILKEEVYILFESEEEYDVDYLTKNLRIRSINSD